MKNVEKDILEAKKVIQNQRTHYFDKYCHIFSNSNENREAVAEMIDFNKKTVLTTASSGDQYLSSVYHNASSVDLYDINLLTKYYVELKIAAAKLLPYQDFMRFIIPHVDTNAYLDIDILNHLLKVLPKETLYFWKNILLDKDVDITKLVQHTQEDNTSEIKKGMPFYQDEEKFGILQKQLKQMPFPNFLPYDLENLPQNLKQQYDIIDLSNIIECLVVTAIQHHVFPSFTLENYYEQRWIEFVEQNMIPFLNKNGQILIDYRMNYNPEAPSSDLLFTYPSFQIHTIDSITENEKNAVLVYTKKS